MDESDAVRAGLRDLEQTLTGVRDRLADLARLAAGQAPAGVPPPGAARPAVGADRAPDPEVLPSAGELCAQAVPEPLVLPPEVEAPSVLVLPEPAEQRTVSLR